MLQLVSQYQLRPSYQLSATATIMNNKNNRFKVRGGDFPIEGGETPPSSLVPCLEKGVLHEPPTTSANQLTTTSLPNGYNHVKKEKRRNAFDPCLEKGVLQEPPTTSATQLTTTYSPNGNSFVKNEKKRNVFFACEDIREKKRREALRCQTLTVKETVSRERELEDLNDNSTATSLGGMFQQQDKEKEVTLKDGNIKASKDFELFS